MLVWGVWAFVGLGPPFAVTGSANNLKSQGGNLSGGFILGVLCLV